MSTQAPYTTRREDRKPRVVAVPFETASRAVGALTKDCSITGMTKGQFSLIDLIKAVIEQTGPAHLVLSTWTQGIRDVDNVAFMAEKGDLLSLRLLTDRSFVTRKPEYCARVLEVFGREAICCTNTHAKFALLRNDEWDICIRSSMNLNRNRRFEQFDIDDSAALCDFFEANADEMMRLSPHGFDWVGSEIEKAFNAAAFDQEPEAHGRSKRRRWHVQGVQHG